MSSRRETRDIWPRAAVGLMILVVLGLVLFVRPGGSDDGTGSTAGASAEPQGPGPTGSPASEDEFCRAFRELAGAQGLYAAAPEPDNATLLREAADALVAAGPPESMPVEARGGLYTVVSGVYSTLGDDLPPSAVPGAADGPQVAGSDQAFGSWLSEVCPA